MSKTVKELTPTLCADYFDAKADRIEGYLIPRSERRTNYKNADNQRATAEIYRFTAKVLRGSASA